MTFAETERQHLADTFRSVGPDAPTLCEGWDAHDLAAHLYVRERQPLAAGGMFVDALGSRLDNAMAAQKARPFEDVVADWEAGPGNLNPIKLVDGLMNTAEHFAHHEDVRRGDGVARPREFSQEVNRELEAALRRMAPMLLRGSSKPVILTPIGGRPIVVSGKNVVAERGDDVVRVTGQPGELLLWVFGRDAVEVDCEGPVDTVSR